MTNDIPAISVIIPTHNRSTSLRRTLDALCNQTFPLQQFEVLVVADGCIDQTVEMLKHYKTPFSLHVIKQSGQGPAIARNNGAAKAIGQLLIFLDDDIESSPFLIEAHALAHQRWPYHVVIGYLPPKLQGKVDFFSIELRTWWESMYRAMRQPGHRYTYRDLLSGNFSLEAELFSRIGGFDPVFWCHEDYELGVRLIKNGIPFVFVADAMGYHHEKTGLDRSLERKYQEGRSDVLLGLRHPELRPVLPLARFNAHFSSLSRLLYNLAFRWKAAEKAIAICLRYLLNLLEMLRLRRLWRAILDNLLGDSYWRGVAKELKTQQSLADFIQGSLSCTNKKDLEIKIDLHEGLELAEQQLDNKRPSSVCIYYGQQLVGQIPSQPGVEHLRGIHLRPILATELAKPMLRALALEGAIDANLGVNRLLTVC